MLKLKRLSKKQKIILVLVVVAIAVAAFVVFGMRGKEPAQQAPEQKPPEKFYSQLTGNEVDKKESERPILGIMIENSEFARPQTGVDGAGIVFEALTEGGITRFLALYQENQPETVGPVRSLREHYLNWVMGFDGSIAHAGGSAHALELSDQRHSKSLSEFIHSGSYYRDPSREAPHDLYAHTADLRKLQDELGHKTAKFKPIPRSNDSPSQTPLAKTVALNFSSPEFQVEFRYDPASNSYVRYLAGSPHIDRLTNKPISTKNVIVMKIPREGDVTLALGSGDAWIFKDGNVMTGKWQQKDFNNRVEFVDANNNEIALNRGDVWVSVIPPDDSITY